MKIAITGGSGFIGARLRERLESAGHECVIIDSRAPNPVDIMDFPSLVDAMQGCEVVYHLAAEHRDDIFPRARYYDVNVKGTRYVATAADKNNIKRIIFVSSFAVYGLNSQSPDEKTQPAPFNDYGESKLEGEQVLREWTVYNKQAHLTIVRPTVIFGEGNRGNVYNLINQIATNKFVMIGRGSNKKSMAYVGNFVAFLHHIMNDEKRGEVYNYCDGPDYTMNRLVKMICQKLGRSKPAIYMPYPFGITVGYACDMIARISGKKLPISAVRVQKFCANTTCSAEKALATGFKPPYTLEEGIERFIASDFVANKKAAA